MSPPTLFSSSVAAVALLSAAVGVVAPVPPCSPLRFINHWAESPEMGWLFSDLPGHPVRPCAYDPNWKDAPPVEKSLVAFFSQPGKAVEELRKEGEWWSTKGFARLNRRFWEVYDGAPLTSDAASTADSERPPSSPVSVTVEQPAASAEVSFSPVVAVDAVPAAAVIGESGRNLVFASEGEDFDLELEEQQRLLREEEVYAELQRNKRFIRKLFSNFGKKGGDADDSEVSDYGSVDYDSEDFRVEHTFARDQQRSGLFAAYDDQRDRAPYNYFFDVASYGVPSPPREFAPQPVYSSDGRGTFGLASFFGGGGSPEFTSSSAVASPEFAARPAGGGVSSSSSPEFSARPSGLGGVFSESSAVSAGVPSPEYAATPSRSSSSYGGGGGGGGSSSSSSSSGGSSGGFDPSGRFRRMIDMA